MLPERLQKIVDDPKVQEKFRKSQEMQRIRDKYTVEEFDCDEILSSKF